MRLEITLDRRSYRQGPDMLVATINGQTHTGEDALPAILVAIANLPATSVSENLELAPASVASSWCSAA